MMNHYQQDGKYDSISSVEDIMLITIRDQRTGKNQHLCHKDGKYEGIHVDGNFYFFNVLSLLPNPKISIRLQNIFR